MILSTFFILTFIGRNRILHLALSLPNARSTWFLAECNIWLRILFSRVITSFRTFVDQSLANGLINSTKLRKSDSVILKFVTHSSWDIFWEFKFSHHCSVLPCWIQIFRLLLQYLSNYIKWLYNDYSEIMCTSCGKILRWDAIKKWL